MASTRDLEGAKAPEADVAVAQLSISSTDSKTELLRGNEKPGRKRRGRAQESWAAADDQRQREEEAKQQAHFVHGDDRELEMGGGYSVDDTSSVGWHTHASTLHDEHEGMHALKPLPPLSCHFALYMTLVLTCAALFAAYMGSGLVLLFHIADHLSPCVRPFWMYANYVLCTPMVLTILGLTNASPCVRLLFVLAPLTGFTWFIVFYSQAGSLSDPSSCNHSVAAHHPHFYRWVIASFMVQAAHLMAVAWVSVSFAARHHKASRRGEGEEEGDEEMGGEYGGLGGPLPPPPHYNKVKRVCTEATVSSSVSGSSVSGGSLAEEGRR